MFKPKILVEIITEQCVNRKKCVTDGHRVIIKKGKGVRGDPTIAADYDKDCILPYYKGMWPLKRLSQKLVWKEGHTRCVSFYGAKVDVSRNDPRGYFEAGALKNAGSTLSKVQVPMMLYLVIAAVLIIQVVQILILRGNLRI